MVREVSKVGTAPGFEFIALALRYMFSDPRMDIVSMSTIVLTLNYVLF